MDKLLRIILYFFSFLILYQMIRYKINALLLAAFICCAIALTIDYFIRKNK